MHTVLKNKKYSTKLFELFKHRIQINVYRLKYAQIGNKSKLLPDYLIIRLVQGVFFSLGLPLKS